MAEEESPPSSPPSPWVRPGAPLPRIPRSYAEDANSPLHVACYTGAYNEALMLLLSGHEVGSTNVWRETPLHQCTAQGHLDIMMLLLDAGADVNSLDHQNLTPLHQALIHGNKDAAELLLSYGASVHNSEGVEDVLSALELASHVHVCHRVVQQALGRVWSLQHLCRITIRRNLGVRKRRRIKELPLPKPVLSFLCALPVEKSKELHQNWDRARSSKAEAVRKRGQAKRPKPTRYSHGMHNVRTPSDTGVLNC